MKSINDISEELRSIGSPLADMSHSMPYSVPEGYFADFPQSLRDKIETDAADVTAGWTKEMPFSVPAGYFPNLAANMLAAAQANDRFSALPKDVPFSTPAGYFESLPSQILAAAKAAEIPTAPKTIPLPRRNIFALSAVRWAAAAVLVVGISVASYQTFFRAQPVASEKILASIPSEEIHDYLQHTYRVDVDRIVSNDVNNLQVENKDIVQYLNENGWDVAE